MGYLKSAVETSLIYAEQAKIPDYVSTIRKSWKPADSVAAQVEALVSTHGAPLVNKIDCKLDPVADAALEKYGMYKEKCTDMIEYAQTKKEGVVMKAKDTKEKVLTKVEDTKKKVTTAAEDIVCQVKTGEIETTILKKAEYSKYTAWLAQTIIGYKGKLVLNAKTISEQIQTKGKVQIVAIKAYATELKGKLPIAEVKMQVEKITAFVTAKSSPYVEKVTPFYVKAKKDFTDAKTKVYSMFVDLKTTYLAKKTA
jgi:hypothetical protein